MLEERQLQINPIVPDSVAHNARTISNVRALTSSVFGIAAGTLGLESYPGFAFFLLGTLLVSGLIWLLRADGAAGKQSGYFYRPASELWLGDMFSGLSSFVLTWTLVYGLVRA